jgi:putative iron-only hydrogenase system regulator
MEKRIGAILILVHGKENINLLNQILTSHSFIIIGRQGIPFRDRSLSIISLVVEGTNAEIGALAGQLGKLKGIRVRSVMAKDQAFDN